MIKHLLRAGLLACIVLGGGFVQAATATFTYDALGRLTGVTTSDGKVAIYAYDPAGNRTQVLSGNEAGVPLSITVPASSSTGAYTISWGAASGTVTAYELYEATNSSFSGQSRIYTGTALSAALTGRGSGTYYYRVRACLNTDCSSYRTGANPVTVAIPVSIQVLNPSISVGATGQITQITTLANLNGNAATINSFTVTCTKASAAIQGGSQGVVWTNSNTYDPACTVGDNLQCTASYAIRNSSSGQLYPGTSAITVVAQAKSPPPGQGCL
jgi:YD repeat-containing protein